MATQPDGTLVLQTGGSGNGPLSAVKVAETAQARELTGILRPVTSLPGLIIACIVCFLFGSLLRSLLTDADFVIYQPSSLSGILPDIHGAGPWRELRRLAEWKIGWDRDLVIAIARRRG